MSAAARGSILVADDNPSTRYVTVRTLRAAGFETVEAVNGVETLAKVDASIDLVVLDINMPDIDGYEVCRLLRAAPGTAAVPIIHLSATFIEDGDRARGLDVGADGYLTHPLEPKVLVSSINALLRVRNAEAVRHASDAKLRAVFDLAPIGIATLAPDGTFRDVNPTFCTLIGHSRDELMTSGLELSRRTFPWYSSTHDPEAVEHAHWIETVFERSDGTRFEMAWVMTREPFSGAQIVMISDISARKMLEREREQLLSSERAARLEAEHATRAKDDFLAMLSHELRNPLASILGWTAVLQRTKDEKLVADGVNAIDRAAKLQQQLVSDLLDLSGILAGKLRLRPEILNLIGVIDDAIAVVAPSAVEKGIALRRSTSVDAERVRADPGRLQQVLWNLLSNALKFTPEGGSIDIDVQREGDSVVVSIRDTGRGIAPEVLPHVFDRFRQGSTSTSRRVGGLGLGLTIVKQLIEMHGGTVGAESSGEGGGSRFRFTLPLLRSDEPLGEKPARAFSRGLKILIVDDDDDQRSWLRRVLEDVGAVVEEASSANAAIAKCARFEPGILLSDISMPGKDGYELMRELRRNGWTPERLPSIALTALALPEDRTAALNAGYQQHVAKPIDALRLIASISAVLESSPQTGSAP